jgi:prepilin-type N-terminal cleavage/methylation domain-containing protein
MSKRHAFTLIEMLVVIAIIGIVATLVISMNVGAQVAKRNTMVNADKMKLTGMIANYQSKLNYYPPDNGNLATTNLAYYDATAAVNPLIYELTGATNNYTNNNGNILTFDGTIIPSNIFYTVFGRTGVANSSTDEPRNFFQPLPQPKEYTNYPSGVSAGATNVWGLVVPVTLSPGSTNFWHYDCSTTNRHNMSSYDLWAEYSIGSRNGTNLIVTNGNWQ